MCVGVPADGVCDPMTIRFSVVVPTHRRPARLALCLEALTAQTYPPEHYEVIVVEDGGPDPELAELRRRSFAPLRVSWVPQDHAGPAAARNHGARRAKNGHLAFTDDDCRPRPDWLARLAPRFAAGSGTVVGGHTVNAVDRNAFSAASQALVSYITDYGQRRGRAFFASNNIALACDAFHGLGGFDATFPIAGGEDRDFCDRALDHGYELIHAPEAVIEHDHHLTLPGFWRQHFAYGRGAYRFHRARAARNPSHRSPEPIRPLEAFDLRFYLGFALYPFHGREIHQKLRVAALLLLSQLPNALGFYAERIRITRTAKYNKSLAPDD